MSFVRIKKLYEMNNQFKNTDIEIAESVDLNEPLEKQIIFLENINWNWLNTFKQIDHPFDVNLVQADLSASLKIVSDILQTLYLVLGEIKIKWDCFNNSTTVIVIKKYIF